VSTVNVEEVLDALGLDYTVRGNEANALCPAHKRIVGREDHSPSWWVNLSTGQHICFSCHYSGGLLALIADVQGFVTELWGDEVAYDFVAARAWLDNIAEIDPERLALLLASIPSRVMESSSSLVPMSRARLALFGPPPTEALEARGVSRESVDHYGVLWDTKKRLWVLPIWQPAMSEVHASSVLLGWQEKGQFHKHFFNRPPGMKKSLTLFGVQEMLDERVIVVESPLDCLRLHTAGFPGAVAICGSSMSEAQFKLIRSSGSVVFAFDNPNIDSAGRKASKEVLELCLKYGVNGRFFNYGSSDKKDPGDMTVDEIAWGMENSISYLYGERAYVQGNAVPLSAGRPAEAGTGTRASSVRDGSW
jgi:hypothetical protein